MRTPSHLPPNELLDSMLEAARFGSGSLLLAQASGGNVSVKSEQADLLWVKASGLRLNDIDESSGMVAVRVSELRALVREHAPTSPDRRVRHEESVQRTQAAALQPAQGRPSLETGFHALFPESVVLHLHPVYVNAFACMENGREALLQVAGSRFRWAPYAAPGQELATKIDAILARAVAESATSPAFILENHGFIAPGSSANQVISLTQEFVCCGQKYFGTLDPRLWAVTPASSDLELAAESLRQCILGSWPGGRFLVRPARFAAFREFCRCPQAASCPGPLVPDDVVYAGFGLRLQSLSCAFDMLAEACPEQVAVAVEGVGVILVAASERFAQAMEEILLAHVLVRMLIARRGKPHILPPGEIQYLREMESEKYRVQVTLSAEPACKS